MLGHVEAHQRPAGVELGDQRVEQLHTRADAVAQQQRTRPGSPGSFREASFRPRTLIVLGLRPRAGVPRAAAIGGDSR